MNNPRTKQYRPGSLTYLYVVISCCMMAGASLGLCFYSASVFYEPIASGLKISIGSAGLTTTIMLVCMAITTLFVPVLMKMIPYRYLLVLGAVCAGGGTLGMSFCFHAAFLYFFAGVQGVGAALIGLVPATAILNNWFYSHSGLLMGLVTAVPALAAALFAPLFGVALTTLGWRMGLVLQAVLIVAFLLPALLLPFAARPERLGMQPYGIKDLEVEEKRKSLENPMKVFACIAAVSILAASLLGISQHFSSYGTSIGKTLVYSAGLFSWCMIGSVVIKLLGGLLGDRIGAGLTTALLDVILFLVSIFLWISMYANNDIVLKVLAFFFGCAYALNDFSVPLLVKNQFGMVRYAKVYSFMNCLSTMTIAISIALVGYLYDAAKSFLWIWVIALVIEAALFVVTWLLIRSEQRTIALTKAVASVMPENLRIAVEKTLPESEQPPFIHQQGQQGPSSQQVHQLNGQPKKPGFSLKDKWPFHKKDKDKTDQDHTTQDKTSDNVHAGDNALADPNPNSRPGHPEGPDRHNTRTSSTLTGPENDGTHNTSEALTNPIAPNTMVNSGTHELSSSIETPGAHETSNTSANIKADVSSIPQNPGAAGIPAASETPVSSNPASPEPAISTSSGSPDDPLVLSSADLEGAQSDYSGSYPADLSGYDVDIIDSYPDSSPAGNTGSANPSSIRNPVPGNSSADQEKRSPNFSSSDSGK